MMKLVSKTAQAGTVESADILVIVSPAEPGKGIQVELVSPTLKQYGSHIRKLIADTVAAQGIADAQVHANDKGALDYTIEARVRTAVLRAIS